MMARRTLLALLAGSLASLLSACGRSDATFRYRLAFSVSINGAGKSGSSIISVHYWKGGASWGTGETTYAIVKGVAPVVDLGQYGMLVAAMAYNVREWATRRKEHGLACKQPLTADSLPGKFSTEPATLAHLREGKRDLTEDSYPAFIWFPPGQPYERAQQICPEEFSRVIGAKVELQSVTIEVAPDAPLLTRLEISAPWLDEIRADQTNLGGVTSKAGIFKPYRTSMIETDGT
ncbi:hypothetical protein SSBR45G_70530 [Bradyrhizobium sp. SSBR45G]|uniref:hypothetical protein n=1 Tax=unclassified Bradyrhizobium TaxID=2631580 RepID=UPI002342ADA7|nr:MULTISPECIES: hypothetical protein [unclassified Bradyrhizobium]GLH82144.1 hypothetical protein SSBR45G_70530 [Bradyrhizobium sp. SSBR45G]GLH89569.1 hypothetical protein SSBR45R_70300 [Bradyrhizobium sp. SSBR45R]